MDYPSKLFEAIYIWLGFAFDKSSIFWDEFNGS